MRQFKQYLKQHKFETKINSIKQLLEDAYLAIPLFPFLLLPYPYQQKRNPFQQKDGPFSDSPRIGVDASRRQNFPQAYKVFL